MEKYLVSIFLIFLCALPIYPQEYDDRPKTNLELINLLLQNDFEKCIEYINILGPEKTYLITTNDNSEVSKYIIKLFKQIYINYKLTTEDKKIISDYTLKFDNAIIKTEYKYEHKNLIFDKYLQRQIFCGFDLLISNKDSTIYTRNFYSIIKDTVDYSYISYIESDGYKFAKGKLPEESFFDKYLIPSTAILVSAVAIVLFFTIRSK
ncbi:MAG: hypothetical protein N2490_06335 [Ignavibacteria bacterium]|nr:hypothetical protein [Ignavibacteria bacterium]